MSELRWLLVLGLAGCAGPTGVFGVATPGFSFLGASHYEGKAFKDLGGQFEAIAVAPVGNRVAFRGREDMGHFDLFVAEVDGKVRKVASTGPSDGLVSWSGDGQVLYYLDSVPRPDGMLDGATIQRYSLASETVQQALYAVPLLAFVPSPDGSRLLVGGGLNRQSAPATIGNQLLDPATGKLQPVAPTLPRISGTWGAVWSPDGTRLALAGQATELIQGPIRLTIVADPEWQGPPTSEQVYSGRYTAFAWEDAQVLRLADIEVGDDLLIQRLDAAGKLLDEQKLPLDSPPAGTSYQYDRPLPTHDGRKLLIARRAITIKTGNPQGNRAFFVCKDGALSPLATTQDLEPIGWTDDDHVLCLGGFYQDRKPVVLDAG